MSDKVNGSTRVSVALRRLVRQNLSVAELERLSSDPDLPTATLLAIRLLLTGLAPSEIRNEDGRVVKHDPVPPRAIAEIMDRLEGKAVQRAELRVTRDRDPAELASSLAALIAQYPALLGVAGEDALSRVGTTRPALEASRIDSDPG